jgi:hypothetical protein
MASLPFSRIPPLAAALLLLSSAAYAQAPSPGFVVLSLPSSPRTTALGNAWVAGRDADVIFYNPAQLAGARSSDAAFAFTSDSPSTKHVTLGSTYSAGKWSLTLGWGVQFVDFHANSSAIAPLTSLNPSTLLTTGPANGSSTLMVVGGAIVYKGFRIGVDGKYLADRVTPLTPGDNGYQSQAILADLGVGRTMFGGTLAASVQNLGHAHDPFGTTSGVPTQTLFGYSRTQSAGLVDFAFYSEGLVRSGWWSPAGGVDMNYSWIEGYSVSLRAGVRRPEITGAKPFAFGAAFSADRLTVEYAVQLYDGRASNGVTVRWR